MFISTNLDTVDRFDLYFKTFTFLNYSMFVRNFFADRNIKQMEAPK